MERQERDSARLDPKGKRPFRVPIYPALVFIASCLVLAGVLYHSYTVYREQMERITKLNTIQLCGSSGKRPRAWHRHHGCRGIGGSQ